MGRKIEWAGRALIILLAISVPFVSQSQGKPGDWLSAPKPKFPTADLKPGAEGTVRLRVFLSSEGNVTGSTVLKSSGYPTLDRSAREGVLTWKMKPAAVKQTDLTQGRVELIEFRQEAPLVARYQDRDAYFESKGGFIKANELSRMWMSAPFPQYPYDSRLHWEEGTVLVSLTIGPEGIPHDVHVFKGSGHLSLDDAAIRAIKHWRARNEYVGRHVTFPITFKMGRRR